MYDLMSVRHGVFASNPLIWLGFNYRARQLGSSGDYSNSAIAASSSLAVNSTPRRLWLTDSASLKYSNSVRPADAFDAALASLDRSTFKSASFTSALRDVPSSLSVCALLCAVVSLRLARTFCPLYFPLLQWSAMVSASRHAMHCQLAASFTAMPRNALALASIAVPSFHGVFRHCCTPRRIT